MRLLGTLGLVVGIAGTAALMLTPSASADIAGSDHDFRTNGWGETQICAPCHTPHNATIVDGGPLWNHDTTTATFTVYTSTTLDAGTLGQPAGVSKLCLSCHDGTVGVDAYGNSPGDGSHTLSGTNTANFGTDLRNDHPISFAYDATLVTDDGELNDPTAAGFDLPLFGTLGDQLECATCHDVHNGTGTIQTGLLRMSNVGSALCLECHDK